MTTRPTNQQPFPGEISRDAFIQLLNIALQAGEHRFARRLALDWLSEYPGDLLVALLQVQAFTAGRGTAATALGMIQHLVLKDPFFEEAYQVGIKLCSKNGLASGAVLEDGLFVVGGIGERARIATWALDLRNARQALHAGKFDEAETLLLAALAEDPPTPLLAVTHAELLERQSDHRQPKSNLLKLEILRHYTARWTNTLPLQIMLAEALIEGAEPDQGVAMLHSTVAEDIAGQVILRMYGPQHSFYEIWPQRITGVVKLPLPASISALYGWNLLPLDRSTAPKSNNGKNANADRSRTVISDHPAGELHIPNPNNDQQAGVFPAGAHVPETLISTQKTLDEIAQKIQRPEIMRSEGRFPTYIILSSRSGLAAQYGAAGLQQVHTAAMQLKMAVNARKNWHAELLYVDDPQSTAAFNLKPILSNDAWAIKKLLTDLDAHLGKRGEMIGAVLIVGGTSVIPFHRLPNPVDDLDAEIYSDNPYATCDENYFVPEWPVGRFPGEASSKADVLVLALNSARHYHTHGDIKQNWWQRVLAAVRKWFNAKSHQDAHSFGFTAAIWQPASQAVYQAIDQRGSLMISPPSASNDYRKNGHASRFGYFNLHGIQDSPNWFGHNNPTAPENGPDYPVALQPSDIVGSESSPSVIFSEACYGAYIHGRKANETIPLRFLASGTRAFVGSTATAYGSVNTPLIAADLLGEYFWKFIRKSLPVGEALRRAKIELIQEMDRRQGYLDGEDQKTIISFVLYGDPLFNPIHAERQAKEILRPLEKPEIHVTCEKPSSTVDQPITEQTERIVKRMVKQYLPGMQQAHISINQLKGVCAEGDHKCATSQLHLMQKSKVESGSRVVMMSKSIQNHHHVHHQFARMTIDDQGRVLKISVSR
ncbi:MAG: C25 family cysteine peptidase [Anaerolineales bacterium]